MYMLMVLKTTLFSMTCFFKGLRRANNMLSAEIEAKSGEVGSDSKPILVTSAIKA